MIVEVKLNSGLGVDLGPNFTLAANVGITTPSIATLSELLSGKIVIVDDLATGITVTSQGSCTNSISLAIGIAPTTTTTTTATPTTTTTTTAAPIYYYYSAEFYDCGGCTLQFNGVVRWTTNSLIINKYYGTVNGYVVKLTGLVLAVLHDDDIIGTLNKNSCALYPCFE